MGVKDFLDFISIHAPHGGSDYAFSASACASTISIHAPHAGSDGCNSDPYYTTEVFLSTLPMRGATGAYSQLSFFLPISIHAPHAGSDYDEQLHSIPWKYFYPRSRSGERRLCYRKTFTPHQDFYPRSPCGERHPQV